MNIVHLLNLCNQHGVTAKVISNGRIHFYRTYKLDYRDYSQNRIVDANSSKDEIVEAILHVAERHPDEEVVGSRGD